jgi:hypothetical protein
LRSLAILYDVFRQEAPRNLRDILSPSRPLSKPVVSPALVTPLEQRGATSPAVPCLLQAFHRHAIDGWLPVREWVRALLALSVVGPQGVGLVAGKP